MAFTQQQLDAIDAAIGVGELTVTFDNKTITYRSIKELKEARDLISRELKSANFVRTSYAATSKA